MLLIRAMPSGHPFDAGVSEPEGLFSGRPQEPVALPENHQRLDGE